MKKALPLVMATAIAFSSGFWGHDRIYRKTNSPTYHPPVKDKPALELELEYSKDESGKTQIALIDNKNSEKY